MSPIEAKEAENQNSAYSDPVAAPSHNGGVTENGEIFRDWIEWLQMSLSKGTITGYAVQIEKLLRFVDKPIRDITYMDLIRYLRYRDDEQKRKWGRGLTNGTQNTIKAALCKFWLYLTLPGVNLVDNNIALHLEHKRVYREAVSPDKILDIKEIGAMLGAAEDNPRDFALLATLYYSGMRKSEGQMLLWTDINFEDRKIHVRNGKGGKSRHITLSTRLSEILMDYQDRTGDRDGHVFKSSGGNYMCNQSIDYAVHKYAAKARLNKHVTPHMFRHSHATHRIEAGDDIKRVSLDLGHESVTITYDLYFHPSKQAREHGIDTSLPTFY